VYANVPDGNNGREKQYEAEENDEPSTVEFVQGDQQKREHYQQAEQDLWKLVQFLV